MAQLMTVELLKHVGTIDCVRDRLKLAVSTQAWWSVDSLCLSFTYLRVHHTSHTKTLGVQTSQMDEHSSVALAGILVSARASIKA